jgi:hypothetical protein
VPPARRIVSPSRLARFCLHECERFLRFASVRSGDRAEEGVPRPPLDPRPVTQAIRDSGFQWEEVVATVLSGRVQSCARAARAD